MTRACDLQDDTLRGTNTFFGFVFLFLLKKGQTGSKGNVTGE
jgi:hypothetical protein